MPSPVAPQWGSDLWGEVAISMKWVILQDRWDRERLPAGKKRNLFVPPGHVVINLIHSYFYKVV